ncbi:hypothetical protein [Sphingomonas sp. NIC1]|uniref:hypothetical protein n=1 Tax=Sphingomonas sp. NIC1 TaxID=1961362 RepID=UPI001CF668E2|nr:hypothetical protein [Sphingomonas sp. NIC1]
MGEPMDVACATPYPAPGTGEDHRGAGPPTSLAALGDTAGARSPPDHRSAVPSWACGDARGAMVDRLSAIDVAWNDVVLRVMGSAGRPRGDAKSFFGLSDAELDRIVAGSWRCPVRPAWQVAARISNVECPRLENRIVGSVVALLLVICAISYWIF